MSRKISVSLTDQEAAYLDKLVDKIKPRSVSALIGRLIAENYVEVYPAAPSKPVGCAEILTRHQPSAPAT